MVTKDCPLNDEALKTFIRSSTPEDHKGFDEHWLLLFVVYNLPTVPFVKNWLPKAHDCLTKNINKRSYDDGDRPAKRQKVSATEAVCPGRMAEIGDMANQDGGIGPGLNLKNKQALDIREKYEILKDADFVLDGLLTVPFHICYLY